ncbi:MAG: LytR/AlgR family response regulator transcription factor [Bacilli bacterium]
MINIIICDDNKAFQQQIESTLSSYLLPSDIDYKIHLFDSYKDIKNFISKNYEVCIYFLDIEIKGGSGLDIANYIRFTDDWKSIILMVTAYEDMKYRLFSKRLLILDFINKFDNLKENLIINLKIGIKILGNSRTIKLNSDGNTKFVDIDSIVYIIKEDTQYCKFITLKGEFQYKGTLSNLMKFLGDNFKYSHRKTLVNITKIKEIKNGSVVFNNGLVLNLLTEKNRKELIKNGI